MKAEQAVSRLIDELRDLEVGASRFWVSRRVSLPRLLLLKIINQ